jgi:hypothetical protein
VRVPDESEIELVYEGPPRGLAALVQGLEDEGLDVSYDPPMEYRGAGMGQEVEVALIVSAAGTVAKVLVAKALEQLRSRWPGIKVRGKHEKI